MKYSFRNGMIRMIKPPLGAVRITLFVLVQGESTRGVIPVCLLGKVNHCPVMCLHFGLLSCVYSVHKGQMSKFTTSSLPRC